MKRIATITTLAALAAMSTAGINFDLDSPNAVVVKPATGFTLVTFSGTVTTGGGFAPTFAVLELPTDGVDTLTFDHFDAAFLAYLSAGAAGTSYAGDIFTLRVASTDSVGMHDLNNSGSGFSPYVEAIVHGSKNGIDAADNEFYSVNVAPVPEPASLGLLGLGGAALVARRRRRWLLGRSPSALRTSPGLAGTVALCPGRSARPHLPVS